MNELLIRSLEQTPLPVQIAFLLHYRKIRHTDFSRKLAVSPATLSNWLSGKTRPKPGKYVPAAAEILDCPPEMLMKGAGLPFSADSCVPSGPLIRSRIALHLSCGEIARFLRITDSQMYKWEKAVSVPDPFGSVLNALFSVLSGDVFARKQNLSELRIRAGLSVRELSRQLCVREKVYWKWEWQNALPLNYLNIVSLFYRIPVCALPAGPDLTVSGRAVSLKFVRICTGISLRDMTGKHGFASYQSYEDGSSVPDYATLRRILDIFGVSTDLFLSRFPLPADYERLEFLRQTRCPLSETAVCRQLNLSPGIYRQGFLPARARFRFNILTDSLPFQLYLPLSPAEKQVLYGDFCPERLRSGRILCGLSAADAAAAVMLSPVTVRSFENGARQPGKYVIRALSDRYSTGTETMFEV